MGMQRLSERVQGIAASEITTIRDLKLSMSGVIGLESGDPDFATPPHIKAAAKAAIDADFTHYTHNMGIQPLREAIARKVKARNGIDADPKTEVAVTTGGMGALFITSQAVVNPGDEVLVPDPWWTSNPLQVSMAGGTPVPVPLRTTPGKGFSLDLNDLQERITPRTRGLILNTPHNPTGMVIPPSQLKAIAQLAVDHDWFVWSDEAYEQIIYDGAKHLSIASLPGMAERTASCFTFSKSYAMPGWRIGYCIAPKEVLAQAYKVNLYSCNGINAPTQKAALAALDGPQDFIAPMVAEYQARRDLIVKELRSMGCFSLDVPQGAFYVLPKMVGITMPSMAFVEHMLRDGKVVTTPGAIFGPSGEGHLRFAYSFSREIIHQSMERLRGVVTRMGVGH